MIGTAFTLRVVLTASTSTAGGSDQDNLENPFDEDSVSLLQTGVQGVRKNPEPSGHFLTNTELAPIESIDCLQEKQKSPSYNCTDRTVGAVTGTSAGVISSLNAGNYPLWNEATCNGNGEFFCDPTLALTSAERLKLTELLSKLRQRSSVTCGRLVDDPADENHISPFYLGVAIATGFPKIDSDFESLQAFGRFVDGRWNMKQRVLGETYERLQCPNTAILIVLPDQRRAFLSSASCIFICKDRGGPEVMVRTLEMFNEGTYKAVQAGILEVYRFLGLVPGQDTKVLSVASGLIGKRSISGVSDAQEGDGQFVIQRTLFALSCLALVVGFAFALIMFCLAPGLIAKAKAGYARMK